MTNVAAYIIQSKEVTNVVRKNGSPKPGFNIHEKNKVGSEKGITIIVPTFKSKRKSKKIQNPIVKIRVVANKSRIIKKKIAMPPRFLEIFRTNLVSINETQSGT